MGHFTSFDDFEDRGEQQHFRLNERGLFVH